ncbi:MAG: hypothetical protein IMW89_21055 [Ktedonobacteraceae bacterium]|nr:hypothetical protein [Ktedonobacteraceae bacterium]
MPRGRKGPPQESIESILLALSRRHNIDSDTLSHYLDRLDEEWTRGAREKVLHLLRSNDPAAHTTAVLVLSELATDFDLEELEDFVTDPTVSDMAKLSLSPVLKELGSDMADEGIVEYLNDPAAAVQQMQTRLLEMVGQSEIGVESILEDVTSMPVERRLAFISWLGHSSDARAANLLVPLLEQQPAKIVSAVLEALEQLGPVAIRQTIPALNHMISASSNREVKQQARTVLGRLTMQATVGAEDMALYESRQPPLPEYEARVSFIDGSGSQLIMLSWQRPDGVLKGLNVLYQDQWGIKECYGVDEIEIEHWQKLVKELNEQGFGGFHVPFAYGRALVMEARALNKRTRHKVPIAYAVWRPFIEVETPDNRQRKRTATIMERPALTSEVLELAAHGADLYRMREFASWLYEPAERIEPYLIRFWPAYTFTASTDLSRPQKASHRRKEHLPETARESLMQELINDALVELIDEVWRERYEVRLRRQAALLQFAGREQHARLACAVAAVLHPSSVVPVTEQSFLRAMMRVSIEQGPLRMMIEALNSGKLKSLGSDFAR